MNNDLFLTWSTYTQDLGVILHIGADLGEEPGKRSAAVPGVSLARSLQISPVVSIVVLLRSLGTELA